MKRGVWMKKKYVFIICIILLVVLFIAAFDVRLKTVTYTIKSSKITGEIKLAFVTDLHSCRYGKNQIKLLGEIEKYQPDAVLLGGDIFDDVSENENANIFVGKITKGYKTYYVSGNHEWWSNRMYDMFDLLSEKGVIVLRGNTDILKIGQDIIAVSGIDDPEVNEYDPSYTTCGEQLKQVGANIEKDCFNLLIAHRPELANQYFEYAFDAALTGHAHGGQFRIPYIMNGLYAPNQGLFPKLAGGIYDFEEKKLIVSRGLARESTRIPRIFNRPEIVFVNLIPEE